MACFAYADHVVCHARSGSATTYQQTVYIKTRNGARTFLLVPELRLFLIAGKNSGDQQTSLLVYKINP